MMFPPYIPDPDPENIRRVIEAISSLNLDDVSIDDIVAILTPIFVGYKLQVPRIDTGSKLFRARICDKPSTIKDLIYPPSHLVSLGRVNRPNNPIMYCSMARSSAFFEVNPQVGQHLVVSHWVTTALLLVNQVGYSRAVLERLNSNRLEDEVWLNGDIFKYEGLNQDIAEFLGNIFTEHVSKGQEKKYKLSVAIAEKLLMGVIVDGLMYPTVAMRANADNIALKPSYVDKNLEFKRAEYILIEKVKEFGFEAKVIDTAIDLSHEGDILWRGFGNQWSLKNQGDELSLSVENGFWVARNTNGDIVEPD